MPHFGACTRRLTLGVKPMKKRWPFIITDLEDRALAMCESAYVNVSLAKRILEWWYQRSVLFAELRQVYEKLHAIGLINVYTRYAKTFVREQGFRGHRTRALSFRATRKAKRYLNLGKRYVV